MTRLVIIMENGVISSIHSNSNIEYIVVNNDLINKEDRISNVQNEDSSFSDYFDILDTEDNNNIIRKFTEK
jgi:hypothetical protein